MINLLLNIFFTFCLTKNNYIPNRELKDNYLNIKKNYNHNNYLNNKLTKVYIHIEPLIKYTIFII